MIKRSLFSDNRFLFVTVCLLDYLVIYLGDTIVFTEDFYVGLLKKTQYSNLQIQGIKEFNTDMGWVFDAIRPFILLAKFCLISGAIYILAYFKNIAVSFGKVMKVVISVEIVFVIAAAIRIVWLSKIPDMDMLYYKSFYPLALINLIDYTVLAEEAWAIVLLKSVNLFQLIYLWALAYFLTKTLKIKFGRTLGMVFLSCFVLFVLYNGGVMFFNMMS